MGYQVGYCPAWGAFRRVTASGSGPRTTKLQKAKFQKAKLQKAKFQKAGLQAARSKTRLQAVNQAQPYASSKGCIAKLYDSIVKQRVRSIFTPLPGAHHKE
jgi:uncharacterized protein YjbI with pentapeptide repeats